MSILEKFSCVFQSGAAVDLLRQPDSEWFMGRCHGKEGLFPASYVDVVRPLPSELVSTAEPHRQVRRIFFHHANTVVVKITVEILPFAAKSSNCTNIAEDARRRSTLRRALRLPFR